MPLKMEIYVFMNLGVNYTFISMGDGKYLQYCSTDDHRPKES